MTFLNDLKVALRALGHAKGLVITVVLTLALGIGANAAIFTLVRGVLLRPLVNRDENRLIYIRQSLRVWARQRKLLRARVAGHPLEREGRQRIRRLFANGLHHGGAWASRAWFAVAS